MSLPERLVRRTVYAHRDSEPCEIPCLKCQRLFNSEDKRTNRLCGACNRENRMELLPQAFERETGRVIRKAIGKN